ncbi:hypothetical protein GCM10027187_13450 [Streptosporangium sandarakinum]
MDQHDHRQDHRYETHARHRSLSAPAIPTAAPAVFRRRARAGSHRPGTTAALAPDRTVTRVIAVLAPGRTVIGRPLYSRRTAPRPGVPGMSGVLSRTPDTGGAFPRT